MANKVKKDHEGVYRFHCPGCGYDHAVYTAGSDNPIIWEFNNDLEKPTFKPSILVKTGRYADPTFDDEGIAHLSQICHFFVNDGIISYCTDSMHALAGQSVVMKDML